MNSFFKSQLTSLVATGVDFLTTIFLKELCNFWYLTAHITGLFAGGFTQFSINRKWTFEKGKNKLLTTIFRFVLVWLLGFTLNTLGVWWLTQYFEWNYIVSKITTSSVLAISLSFFLQKKFVFK